MINTAFMIMWLCVGSKPMQEYVENAPKPAAVASETQKEKKQLSKYPCECPYCRSDCSCSSKLEYYDPCGSVIMNKCSCSDCSEAKHIDARMQAEEESRRNASSSSSYYSGSRSYYSGSGSSYSGSGSSSYYSGSGSGSSSLMNDPDDYDNPDDYADDAFGEDFDDWDDAYEYWEDNN